MYGLSEKNLLSSKMCSTSPHNMANFGPLAAEIGSGVCGTPANLNGFHVLAALLHATLVVGVSQTLRGERQLYLTRRPSRWALAHILVYFYFSLLLHHYDKKPDVSGMTSDLLISVIL